MTSAITRPNRSAARCWSMWHCHAGTDGVLCVCHGLRRAVDIPPSGAERRGRRRAGWRGVSGVRRPTDTSPSGPRCAGGGSHRPDGIVWGAGAGGVGAGRDTKRPSSCPPGEAQAPACAWTCIAMAPRAAPMSDVLWPPVRIDAAAHPRHCHRALPLRPTPRRLKPCGAFDSWNDTGVETITRGDVGSRHFDVQQIQETGEFDCPRSVDHDPGSVHPAYCDRHGLPGASILADGITHAPDYGRQVAPDRRHPAGFSVCCLAGSLRWTLQDSRGGNDYANNIKRCVGGFLYKIGDQIPCDRAGEVGPTRAGRRDRCRFLSSTRIRAPMGALAPAEVRHRCQRHLHSAAHGFVAVPLVESGRDGRANNNGRTTVTHLEHHGLLC